MAHRENRWHWPKPPANFTSCQMRSSFGAHEAVPGLDRTAAAA